MRADADTSLNIVVGFDFSELGSLALSDALGLASLNPNATLHVLGVVDDHRGLGPVAPERRANIDTTDEVMRQLQDIVDARASHFGDAKFHSYVHVRIGAPADEILALATEADADVIVVGTHGRQGVKRWLMGSVAEKVVRHAGCPVLVTRPKAATTTTADEAVDAGEPEPACPHCVTTRLESDNKQWWCDIHTEPHEQPHRYSYRQNISGTSGDPWSTYNK